MPTSAYLHLTNTTVFLLRRARLALPTLYLQGDSYAPETHTNSSGVASTSIDASGSSNDLMLDVLDYLASRFEEATRRTGGNGGDSTAFETMDAPSLWLDPLEALPIGGDDAYESWFQPKYALS